MDEVFNDDVVSAACFYALRDITQEIKAVANYTWWMDGTLEEELARRVSKEDLKIFCEWLKLSGRCLQSIAEDLGECTDDVNQDTYTERRKHWDMFSEYYNEAHKTMVEKQLQKFAKIHERLKDGKPLPDGYMVKLLTANKER